MDDDGLSSLSILLILLVLHALINLSYSALTNARHAALQDQADSGRRGAQRALAVLDNLLRLNITQQLSLLLLVLAMTAITTVNLVPALADAPAADLLIGGLVLLYLVILLLGSLLPSAIGSAYADSLAPLIARLVQGLILMFTPLTLLVIAFSRLIAALLGGDKMAITVTEEEIMTLVDAGQKEGTIDDEEKAMIFSVLQFGETLVREVMIPRIDIVALEINTPLNVALDKFLETGHSRIPVYDERIDNIEGLLYAKDLLAALHNGGPETHTIRELMRPAYFVPETKRADLALKEMQSSTIHMAIVVDEYGGTAGIVTIENLIEEIVGEIYDEYDAEEESEFIQIGDNEFSIDASMDLDDINELLDVSLPTEDHDTLGGYIYSRLGRVPLLGETLEDPEHRLSMQVKSVEGRRIRKVHVTRKRDSDDPETPAPDEKPDGVPQLSDKRE